MASIFTSLAREAFKHWQDAKERERGEWEPAIENYRNAMDDEGGQGDILVDFGPDDIIPAVVIQFMIEWQHKFDTFSPVPNSWVDATLKEKLDEKLRDLLMADQMNEPGDDFSYSYCYDGVLKGTHQGTLSNTALLKFHSLLLQKVKVAAQQAMQKHRKEAQEAQEEEKHQACLSGQPKVDTETGEIILADQTDCIVPYDLPLKGRVVVLTGAFKSHDDLKRRLTKAGALHSGTHPYTVAIPDNWDYLVVATFASQMYGSHDKGRKHEQYQQIKAEGHHCLMISENTLLEHLGKAA